MAIKQLSEIFQNKCWITSQSKDEKQYILEALGAVHLHV